MWEKDPGPVWLYSPILSLLHAFYEGSNSLSLRLILVSSYLDWQLNVIYSALVPKQTGGFSIMDFWPIDFCLVVIKFLLKF